VKSTSFASFPKQCGAQDRQRAQWRGRIRLLCSVDLRVTSDRPPSLHIATGLHRADPFVSRPESPGGSQRAERGFVGTGMFVVNEAGVPEVPPRATAQAQPLSRSIAIPRGDLAGRVSDARRRCRNRTARNSAGESAMALPIGQSMIQDSMGPVFRCYRRGTRGWKSIVVCVPRRIACE
jgi:hypothetical protein